MQFIQKKNVFHAFGQCLHRYVFLNCALQRYALQLALHCNIFICIQSIHPIHLNWNKSVLPFRRLGRCSIRGTDNDSCPSCISLQDDCIQKAVTWVGCNVSPIWCLQLTVGSIFLCASCMHCFTFFSSKKDFKPFLPHWEYDSDIFVLQVSFF